MGNTKDSDNTRYSAKGMAKPVNFLCIAPEAQEVCVIGDFNDWKPDLNPMIRQIDGAWSTQIDLHHGHPVACTHLPSPRDATLSRMPSSA